MTASDNLNSDSYGGEYNRRDTFMSRGIIDTGGGEQMGHTGTKYGNKHISDRIMMQGSDRGIVHGSDNCKPSIVRPWIASCDRSYNRPWIIVLG